MHQAKVWHSAFGKKCKLKSITVPVIVPLTFQNTLNYNCLWQISRPLVLLKSSWSFLNRFVNFWCGPNSLPTGISESKLDIHRILVVIIVRRVLEAPENFPIYKKACREHAENLEIQVSTGVQSSAADRWSTTIQTSEWGHYFVMGTSIDSKFMSSLYFVLLSSLKVGKVCVRFTVDAWLHVESVIFYWMVIANLSQKRTDWKRSVVYWVSWNSSVVQILSLKSIQSLGKWINPKRHFSLSWSKTMKSFKILRILMQNFGCNIWFAQGFRHHLFTDSKML